MATDAEVQAPEVQAGQCSAGQIESRPGHRPLYRLSVEQYHRISEAGIIPSGAAVELIEGLLVRKMPKNPPHIIATALLNRLLLRLLPDDWFVLIGDPIMLEALGSEPEPDVMIVRGNPRDYRAAKPGPDAAALVIEVADTSYRYDRQVKWALYAAAGVPVYWIVDLNRRVLEVHADPSAEGYRSLAVLALDDEAPVVLDGREVARLRVADILP